MLRTFHYRILLHQMLSELFFEFMARARCQFVLTAKNHPPYCLFCMLKVLSVFRWSAVFLAYPLFNDVLSSP